ncbi:MAG: ATP-binding protein [Verrucomicrobiales bacterium]|nr:ATP-binding protein [Verrucomicrobiales bacterium]
MSNAFRDPNRPAWRRSLAGQLAGLWAIVLGAAVGLSSWIAHQDARKQLLGNLEQTVKQDARVIQLRLETWIRTFKEDARSTSQSPLLKAFLSARNTPEEPLWRGMAEGEFRAGFVGKPAYFQMRLLQVGGENDGQEILRLDREGGRLVVMPRDRLQKKSGRSYYQEALTAPDASLYLSKVDLNRDFGGITEPHIPTIRAAVGFGGDEQQAMLIINSDLRPLFAEINNLSSPSIEVVLADSEGDFLLHPNPELTFASDQGHDHRLTNEPAEGRADTGALSIRENIPLGGWPERSLTLLVSLPEATWRAELVQSRRRGIWATVLASLGGAGVAILISLPFTRRLRRLSSALSEFDAQGSTEAFPDSDAGQDEIGVALERFREMSMKVRQHVEDLQKARDDAHEANAAKETFLAVMSHEIRTPMNAVVGLIRALEKNHPPSHQQPILTSLRSSASNLMTLLNTALDYTRLREGAIDYASEAFDAASVVREVADALTPSALAKQLELQTDIADGLLVVQGDPVRFRQVVNNLLNNAVKFTDKGYVRVALRYTSDQLECIVSDSGPGVAAEDQANIFTPFFTLSNPEATSVPGAGLGLSVSKQMVEQQGGQLSLASQLGAGSTFTVRLPYTQGHWESARESKVLSARPHIRKGLRILYAEDVLSNQEVMTLTLEPVGITLRCADNASDALTLFEQEAFDLVMVDLQLPDMSGDELARKILETNPAIPIIAVTAQSSARTDERIREAGIKAVILKPFTEEGILELIHEHAGSDLKDSLTAIHPHDPERASQLALTMAKEFRAASDDLRRAARLDSWEASVREIRSIRHKLTTAMAQFSLTELQTSLDQLVNTPDVDSELTENAIALLDEAALRLREFSNLGNPNHPARSEAL